MANIKSDYNSLTMPYPPQPLHSSTTLALPILCLPGALLVASARCVKAGGHFVEIGKYDMQANTAIPRILVQMGCSRHGVQVDELWLSRNQHLWQEVHDMVQGNRLLYLQEMH